MRGLTAGLGAALLLPTLAWSQLPDCFPSKSSNEAQLFAALSVPLAYSTAESPRMARPGEVRVGLEGTYLPNIDAETRTPRTCRPGKGPENANLLSVLPRPRVSVGFPGGLMLQASWVPPIPLNGVRANLVGLSLQRAFPLAERAPLLTLRAHGAFGGIRAPITCNDAALQDPASVCYQGTRSDDRYHPNIFGFEGALSWSLGDGRVRPFVGGGLNVLHPRFQVNFADQFGVTDNRKVEVDLTRGVLFGGLTWTPREGLGLSGQIYGAPGDAVTGRVMASNALR
jgi:hypothetical protein